MQKLSLTLILALALTACGRELDGTQTGINHYKENAAFGEEAVGDLKITTVSTGDSVMVTFALPDPDWKDPRPQRIADDAPQSFLARAGCTLTATRKESGRAALDPGQTCKAGDETLTIEGGSVGVIDSYLFADLAGELDRGDGSAPARFYLTYPYIIIEEPLDLVAQ